MVAAGLLLTGCASEEPTTAAGTSAPGASTVETPTATATPTPAPMLTVGLDGIEYTDGAAAKSLAFDDPESLLTVIEELIGEPRHGEDFEDPWGNGDVWGTTYRWTELTVSVMKDGPASIAVLAPTVGGVPVRTLGGVAVGDTRETVVAAGGWDSWDEDGDGEADYLGIDEREAQGTQSLSRPGAAGREYIVVVLDGDVVSQLQSPGNDFADI
ncbi:hypothetical protein ACFVSU_10740 [Microbacterium sp. NPDC058062]|uniref:hypothetical protein n=1 Tax=Microbacterium sp. NPDC058062 TaxID=3346320 RepID=UPI0036DF8101